MNARPTSLRVVQACATARILDSLLPNPRPRKVRVSYSAGFRAPSSPPGWPVSQLCANNLLIAESWFELRWLAALCCSSIPANPASLAADVNNTEPTAVAAVEFATRPSLLRELGSPILKNSSAATPGYIIRRTAPEVRLQFSVADERGRVEAV